MNKIDLLMPNYIRAELNKYNAKKNNDSPVAVVMQGKYDATNALGSATHSLLLQIAKTHNIAIKIIDDAACFGQSIHEACLHFNKKASLLVILSHGRSDWLKFGEDAPWYKLRWTKKNLYEKEDIAQKDFSCLSLDAKIFLLSCSSGQGLAQAISNASKRIVFAPMGFIYDTGTCLQNWPNPEVQVLSYNENHEQHIGMFTPNQSSAFISSLDIFSVENKASFSAMADYLRKRAEKGDADSQLKLGNFYLCGKGNCERSEEEAAYWISLAAEKGLPRAQYVMGFFHLSGQGGIEKSIDKAIEWFQRSAKQEFPPALFQIGAYFYNGQYGFVQSDEEAYKMFFLAAKKGMPQANYYLGFMHEHGRGVWRSLKCAKNHYKVAKELGVLEAKFRLANLLFQQEQQLLGGCYFIQRLHVFVIELLQGMKDLIAEIRFKYRFTNQDLI